MRSNRKIIFIVLMVFGLCLGVNVGNVCSEHKTKVFTLTPSIGRYVFDCEQKIKTDLCFSLGAGYNFTKNWGLEAFLNYLDTESKCCGDDVSASLYHLDGLYHFNIHPQFTPYCAAGLGSINLNYDQKDDESGFLFNYGAGAKYFFLENVALRGDLRHIISFDETYNNILISLGLTFQFGKIRENLTRNQEDSDGDGVSDRIDECPGTPAGAKVDLLGCPSDSDRDGVFDYMDKCPDTPAKVAVDSYGCPFDSDGDGVLDDIDRCPNTPRGINVDQRGCPLALDSDGDGVLNDVDRCPGTPQGATVNWLGCWVIQQGVLFDTDKWDIKPSAFNLLDNVAEIIRRNPSLRIEIQGHTDNQGSKTYNQRLSENRAQAVMEYLMIRGVGTWRLRSRGFNFSQPVASNNTPVGRARNRRVELLPIPER